MGRKWLFHRDQLERLLGLSESTPAPDSFSISARNRLRGRISTLRTDGLMAEVTVRIGDQELVAVITRSSAESMDLRIGDEAFAVIKATEVIVGKHRKES